MAPDEATQEAPDQGATLRAVSRLRPELVDKYLDVSQSARPAALARLCGAFARQPISGIRQRRHDGDHLTITLHGDHTVNGPADAAQPFRTVDRLTLPLDGRPYDHPARLVDALPLAGA